MLRTKAPSISNTNPLRAGELERRAQAHRYKASPSEDERGQTELDDFVIFGRRTVIPFEDYAVDVTSFIKEHASVSQYLLWALTNGCIAVAGGASILQEYAVFADKGTQDLLPIRDATQGFLGRFNNNTRRAREKMRSLSVAEISLPADDLEFL
jgi:hypothetical protein